MTTRPDSRTVVVFHHKALLSRMQTFERLHLLRDARLTKYARDGRVDVAVFVLVLTNEHEYRHFVVLPAFIPRTFSSWNSAQTRRRGITASCRWQRSSSIFCRGFVEFKGWTQNSLAARAGAELCHILGISDRPVAPRLRLLFSFGRPLSGNRAAPGPRRPRCSAHTRPRS